MQKWQYLFVRYFHELGKEEWEFDYISVEELGETAKEQRLVILLTCWAIKDGKWFRTTLSPLLPCGAHFSLMTLRSPLVLKSPIIYIRYL